MNTDGSYQESRWLQSKYWFDFTIYWLEVNIVISKTDVSLFTVHPGILLCGLNLCRSHGKSDCQVQSSFMKAMQVESMTHLCCLGFIDDVICLFCEIWKRTHAAHQKHFHPGLCLGNMPVLYCYTKNQACSCASTYGQSERDIWKNASSLI